MDYSRRGPLIVPPQRAEGKPASRIGLIIGIVILAMVVIALLVAVIVLATRKTVAKVQCSTNSDCNSGLLCSNNVCVSCISPPGPPTISSVSVVGTAVTLTWSAVNGASAYNIYGKLEDPSVGYGNNDQKQTVTVLSANFTNLTSGTHYYVVTAVNSCGESQPSSPSAIVPVCSSTPTAPAAPTVVQSSNDCAGATSSDIINVSFPDLSIPNGVYVVQGTGQKGSIHNYFYLVQGNSWGPATGIHLGCGGVSTTHKVTRITNVQNAPLTVSGSSLVGVNFNMTWNKVAGSEKYLVFLVGVNSTTGTPHFYGGYAAGTESSLLLDTNSGDTLVFGLVLGFRVCDQSPASALTTYITAA